MCVGRVLLEVFQAFLSVFGRRDFGLRPAEAKTEVHNLHYIRFVVYYQYSHTPAEKRELWRPSTGA